MKTFDIRVTIGWIKGLSLSENYIQAVWEAFGLPHQTLLQKVAPIFDAQGGHVGMATWNESFEIQDVLVESEDVECYLEIAFWQYIDPSGEPVAIGFKRVDISDFHKNHSKVLEIPVEIDQQTHLAQAHIQLSVHEKVETTPQGAPAAATEASIADGPEVLTESKVQAPQLPQSAPPPPPEVPPPGSIGPPPEEPGHSGPMRQEAVEELRRVEAQKARLEEQVAAAKAERDVQIAEVQRLVQAVEAERALRLAAEAAAAQAQRSAERPAFTFQAVPLPSADVVLLTGAQKVALFRDLLLHFCGVSLPQDPVHPVSSSVSVPEDPTPLPAIAASILREGEAAAAGQQEVQSDVQEKLMYDVLASYVACLGNGRALVESLRHEAVRCVQKLLRLPSQLPAFCFPDLPAARSFAFEAAQRRAAQKAAALQAPGHAVFYFSAAQQPLPPVPHDALVRLVPQRSPLDDRLDEESLNNMLNEDSAAGHVPCLLAVTVGLSGPAFCDDAFFLQTVSKSFGLVLHLEGSSQFLTMTRYPEAEKLLPMFQDHELALSMTFPLQQLFAFLGWPASCSMTFLRYPGVEDLTPANCITAPDVIGLYSKFRTVGLAAIRAPAIRKTEEAAYLLHSLHTLGCVEMLTDISNLLNIRFHFVAPEAEQDPVKTNEINSMLHQMFLRSLGSATDALNTVTFQSNQSGTQYFAYNMLLHDMAKTATDGLCSLFGRCSTTLQSIIQYSTAMQQAVQQIETLILMPDISKAPLALACFRLIPPFYRTFERLSESHVRDLNSINNKLIGMLQQEDGAFHGTTVNGQIFVVVGSDAAMTIVFTEEYVSKLVEKLKSAVAKLEADDEILSKIQAEITKRGIEVAERQILQSKQAHGQQESFLRLLPVVGSLANWWAPMEKMEESESFSFDLRTSTLTKQVPGKLKPLLKE